jgi:integrase
VKRLLGDVLIAEATDATVKDYQSARLREDASPKTINEEVGFLLRFLEDRGDAIRAKMRRQKTLKLAVQVQVARAFTPEEKAAMIAEARARRSPHILPALMLALHAGLRDAEIRGIQWERLDLHKAVVTVGASKTDAGAGRTVPLNADVLGALVDHSKWYLKKFGEMRPEWYVFPFGKPQPTDPTPPATSFKTVWSKVKAEAAVTGRWHDNRHTFITNLAETPGVTDETIRQLAGHVSPRMLKHYSHIRMEAKRRAVEGLTAKPDAAKVREERAPISVDAAKEFAKAEAVN